MAAAPFFRIYVLYIAWYTSFCRWCFSYLLFTFLSFRFARLWLFFFLSCRIGDFIYRPTPTYSFMSSTTYVRQSVSPQTCITSMQPDSVKHARSTHAIHTHTLPHTPNRHSPFPFASPSPPPRMSVITLQTHLTLIFASNAAQLTHNAARELQPAHVCVADM
ncbi:uncharacterized protein IWZ02DRAFT_253170 [Phyllosticta citriasiana]|uniref:uncharacterized protein n=1 Tax=Phyllosticta citriasiana TaxID=595635 RepID=UPI0030FDACAC